jgi:transposase
MSHREEKAMPMVTPRVLGIDEICLGKKKRDKYRCVVTNIEGGKLIGFLRDRDKPTVIKYFHTLDASAVEVICMDMWPTYRDAARLVFPKAIIVIDRFHIVRMVQNSIEAYRKQLRRDTTGRQRAMLFSDRFTLMSRNIDLDPFKEATLQSWFRLWPEMEHVYDAKERFLDIWLAETKEEAIYLYDAWNNSIPEYVRKYFKDIFTAFSNWSNEIFTYWDYKFTNAFTEGLNSVIRRVYDSGEGYSFEVLRFKLLFTKGTHQLYHKKKPFKARAFDNCTFARTTGATDDTETVSYGVDISTLIEFVNSGKIK